MKWEQLELDLGLDDVVHVHGQHGPHRHTRADYRDHQRPIDGEILAEAEDAQDEASTDAFIKGALEGRFGAHNDAGVPQTAFVVIIDANGEAEAYADPRKFPKYTQRQASLGDIRRACNEIVTEINLQTSARITAEAISPIVDTERQDSIRTALQERGIDVRK